MKINEKQKMLIFLLALIILSAFSIGIFSINVLYMFLVAIASAFVVELVFAKGRKKEIKFIYWLQTPLLFVLFMPALEPHNLDIVAFGSMFAVLFGKAVFGGDDNYLFNPAIVGMLFVTISFPQQLNNEWVHGFTNTNVLNLNTAEALKTGALNASIWDLLIGNSAGAVGEVFRLLILVLGIVLIAVKAIDWKIPLSFLVSYFVLSLFGNMSKGNYDLLDAFKPLMVGTVMLTAFFVAPDTQTAAKYPIGRVLYGIGLGLFTFIIRSFSEFADGLIFVIVIMNMIAPLLDKIEEAKYNPVVEEEEGALT